MPERQCNGCTRQVEWGCTARKVRDIDPKKEDPRDGWENPAYLPVTIDKEDVYCCPRQHIKENQAYWAKLMRFYRYYKKGYLPEPGAVVNQSSRILDLFSTLDSAHAECDEQEREVKARPKGPPPGARTKQPMRQ